MVLAARDVAIPAALRPRRELVWRPFIAALLGVTALMGFYLGVISWAQGWTHATTQLRDDLWFIAPMIIGFGIQVGLFVYLHRLNAAGRVGLAATAGSTGVSTTAMVACCAHHLTDVFAVLGVGGAAIFLNDIKTPLAGVGLALNAAGIAYLTLRIRRVRGFRPPLGRLASVGGTSKQMVGMIERR